GRNPRSLRLLQIALPLLAGESRETGGLPQHPGWGPLEEEQRGAQRQPGLDPAIPDVVPQIRHEPVEALGGHPALAIKKRLRQRTRHAQDAWGITGGSGEIRDPGHRSALYQNDDRSPPASRSAICGGNVKKITYLATAARGTEA